jgi:pilus assembly protein CpaC
MNITSKQKHQRYAQRRTAISPTSIDSLNRGSSMPQFLLAGLLALLSVFSSASLWAAQTKVLKDSIMLFAGESKVIQAANVSRLSVGNSDILSSTLLKIGEIVLIAETAGETNMQFWFADGHRETVAVRVVESNGLLRESRQVKQLLKNIPGVEINTVGQRIVIDGNIEARDLDRVNKIKENYPAMLILAREITDYEQKMIYFDIQVTEVNRDVTEEYGINWSKSFSGPSYGYEKAWQTNNVGVINNSNGVPPMSSVLSGAASAADLAIGSNIANDKLSIAQQQTLMNAAKGEFAYFGINTSLLSVINMLEQTGSAITLAEPRLSSRSGGTAALTVGGEVPVVTSSTSGQTVTYKDYGIILGIEPTLDIYNNIVARVSVSVSQLDLANAVDGQPAFKKRFTENDVRLKPGETLALSGLITREEQIAYSGLKWLSEIPILGQLFKSKSFVEGETELVILVTPRVIEDLSKGINDELVKRSKEMVLDFNEASDALKE